MSVEIKVPTLGESVSEATIAQWLKQPGDTVKQDEPLVELETDKVTLEVNAPSSGTIGELLSNTGDNVEVGAVLGYIEEGDAPAAKPAPSKKAAGGGGTIDVGVPTLGESVSEATVGDWRKKAGESVAQDEVLVELETDKVTVE